MTVQIALDPIYRVPTAARPPVVSKTAQGLTRSARTLPPEIVEIREQRRSSTTESPGPRLSSARAVRRQFAVEEHFEAVVDEVQPNAIRLRTRSSEGEEGVAWLEIAKIPDGERKHIALGAPLRITVVVTMSPRRVRETEIRFLRLGQWGRPSEAELGTAAQYLLERMQRVLETNPER